MKSFLVQKNLPCLLLVVYLIKCLFFPVGFPDALIGIVLASLFGTKLYFDYHVKPDLITPALKRLESLEAQNSELLKLKTKFDELDGKVATITMGVINNQSKNQLNKFGW